MHLVDAVIAIARSDVPRDWDRYSEIASRVLGNVPDAAREMLRQARLTRGSYDTTQRGWSGGPEAREAFDLEQLFLEKFVAAVQTGRYSVRGFRPGDLEAPAIPRALITVEAFKSLKRDQWQLAGTTWHRVHVVVDVPPAGDQSELRPAGDAQIHAAISAEYADCTKTGRKPPNVNEIRKPVRIGLRAKGLYASGNHIRILAGDPRYDEIRRKPGRTLASERQRPGKMPPER